MDAGLSGSNVVGIGVMVEQRADGLLITSVAPNAPAAEAGLHFGDLIVGVDGVTIQDAGSPDALTALVAGEEGTPVTITVLRDGEELEATMTRAEVSFPSVTGGFVALSLALYKLVEQGVLESMPLKTCVAAISAGIVDDQLLLDLCYEEDSAAQVDLNCVMTGEGELVELQGTGEGRTFTIAEQQALVDLCAKGIREVQAIQRAVLGG